MGRLLMGLVLVICAAQPLPAQGIVGKLKQKAKEKAAQESEKGTQAVVDTAASKTEHAVKCLISDKACIQNATAAGQPVVVTNSGGQPVSSADSAAAIAGATGGVPPAQPSSAAAAPAPTGAPPAGATPGQGVWLNYDFVPGDRTIWFDDFSGEKVGDFPQRMDLKDGNLEVVDYQGAHYLHTTTGGTVVITLAQPLPERFTVEADYTGPRTNPLQLQTKEGGSENFGCYPDWAFAVRADGGKSSGTAPGADPKAIVHCRFTIDGQYIKGYVNENRLVNLPKFGLTHSNQIFIRLPGDPQQPGMLSNLRIAAGGQKLYDALAASGRVATHGILFDTGSDQIRPESTPTLKEIGQMLTEHPELKLTIEGHTDNVGDAAANQDLSERRAAAVKQYLVTNAGIDAARLTTKGFGASKPVGPNDTPEGRQNNRRVELVKS